MSKDEIGTIRWDVSSLIEDIESDFLNELADKDFNDLKNIENKFDRLYDRVKKENE